MDEELRVHYLLGQESFRKNDYQEAEKHLSAFVREVAHFADVWQMLGVIYHEQGKFNRAVECFEKALAINPKYTEALLSLAVTFNDLGQYDKAQALYANAKRGESSAPPEAAALPDPFVRGKIANMHAELGDVYRSIGLQTEAIIEYQKALKLRPEFPDIRTKLAQSLHDQGQKEQALKELMEIKRSRPDYLLARINLGVTHYSMGRLDEAVREWQEVLAEDPENKKAQMYLRLVQNRPR